MVDYLIEIVIAWHFRVSMLMMQQLRIMIAQYKYHGAWMRFDGSLATEKMYSRRVVT